MQATGRHLDTNIYNLTNGGSFTTKYSGWIPLRFVFVTSYQQQDFKGLDSLAEEREDHNYLASLETQGLSPTMVAAGTEIPAPSKRFDS